jgi:RNA polymerase sigma-70 factor (ECF subfamily)
MDTRMMTLSSGGVRGGLLRFPLPGLAAEGIPGSAVQKTRRGPSAIVRDAMTFEDVVREHQNAVYGAALRILGDPDAALDAANQAFMKAYRSIASYDPSRPIKHWLLRIAVNEAITIGRARTRERARSAPEADAAGVPAHTATPEAEAVDRESRDGIRAAVARLPVLYREVVVLRYFNELSVDEVADVLGRSSSTVGVQLLRARQLLRKAMADQSV